MSAFSFRGFGNIFHFLLTLALALSGQMLAASPAFANNATDTIVDTLGVATPSTRFQLAGAGGQALSSYQQVGPQFVLSHRTKITEIGAFITYCELLAGVTECPSIRPVVVQIRPALNGQPDLTKVLGTYVLSTRHSPKVYSYESVHPDLWLKPGTYFAIFKVRGDGSAGLLSTASTPFTYQAGMASLGFIFQPDGRTGTSQLSLAVRVLGKHGSEHEKKDGD
jgi:hypothetical protein